MMVDELGFDEFGRPCKELYFMNLCFAVAKRSIDPSTRCGAVITDQNGFVLSTGYNGPIMGAIDMNIPLTGNARYDALEHSERNSIYAAARRGTPLENSIFYVTGIPCLDCARAMIQCGASKIIYGPLTARMINTDYLKRYKNLGIRGSMVTISKFKYLQGLLQMSPDIAKVIECRPDVTLEI
jgi:dCMP deaminase